MVRSGRFGPYVTDGTTNASLRKGDEPETITIERAAELLADRRAAGPPAKRPAGPPRPTKAAKKAAKATKAAKKAAAKKATGAKKAAKATAAKKATRPPRRPPAADAGDVGRGRPRRRERARPAHRPRRGGRLRQVDARACAGRRPRCAARRPSPGPPPLGATLRRSLLDPGCPPVSDRAEALLMAADRAQHVAEVVVPALEAGRWVVTDRFSGSTLAYQGYGRGLDLEELRAAGRRGRRAGSCPT